MVARVKRSKKRRRKSTKGKFASWLRDKLDGDQWAEFPAAEIAAQAKVHRKAVSRLLIPLVSELTERPLDEVRSVHERRWKHPHTSPFTIFCIQQLRQKKWSLNDITSLVEFSYTTVRTHSLASLVELPPDTTGYEVSDQLRRVLADELGIGIRPDGTTYRLGEASSQDAAKSPALDTSVSNEAESASPAKEEPSKQDTDILQTSRAPDSPAAADTPTQSDNLVDGKTDAGSRAKNTFPPYDKTVELPEPTVIYIVQKLYQKGNDVDAILGEGILKLRSEAQVYKCLDHPEIPFPDYINPNYERIMHERQLFPQESAPAEEDDRDRFFRRPDVKPS